MKGEEENQVKVVKCTKKKSKLEICIGKGQENFHMYENCSITEYK